MTRVCGFDKLKSLRSLDAYERFLKIALISEVHKSKKYLD